MDSGPHNFVPVQKAQTFCAYLRKKACGSVPIQIVKHDFDGTCAERGSISRWPRFPPYCDQANRVVPSGAPDAKHSAVSPHNAR
ncbi:MAG: hypothetical protein JWR51_497 [Devosia sp.]|nr:hypothetical protein [Devosia sp.]